MSDVVVRLASLDEVRDLQLAVLRPNGPLPNDAAPPPDALHIGALLDGTVIGAATILPAPLPATWPGTDGLSAPARSGTDQLPEPTWQLRSMAVRADLRGREVGRRVLARAVEIAHERGGATLFAAARVSALGFYTGAGWSAVGPVWDKPGVGPHRWVFLDVGADARLRA